MFKSQIIKQMIVKLQGFQIMFCLFYTILAFDTFKNKVDQLPVFKNQEFRYPLLTRRTLEMKVVEAEG